LGIPVYDLHLVFLAAGRQPIGQRFACESENVRVAFAETAERAGPRAHETDLDNVARLRKSRRHLAGKCESTGAGGCALDEIAARHAPV